MSKKKRPRIIITRHKSGLNQPDVDGNAIQDKGIDLHFDEFYDKRKRKRKDDTGGFDEETGFIDELH